jgi:DNA-binding transcriptional regulator LsrR (DeoR family)
MQSADPEQMATLVHVANLYYKDNISQREIAEKLGVSRSLIALYLQRAREQGIVKIEIINPQDSCANLALELRNRAKLDHVTVVPHGHISPELTRRATAAAAAQFLEEHLTDNDVFGLGWGRTTALVAELLAPTRLRSMHVVPLLGESSHTSTYSQLNHLVLRIAQNFGGQPHFLLAPILVGSKQLRDLFMDDNVVRDVAQQWEHLTTICFGIGAIPPTAGMVVYLGEEHIPMLQARQGVGDVCARPFREDGELITTELNERMIAVSVEQMRRATTRVAVATGADKALAVAGALRTGLITTLFVDAQLAQTVIEVL